MKCPYCGFQFKKFLANVNDASEVPDLAPFVCEGCCGVLLLIDRKNLETVTPAQLAAIKTSPAWLDVLEPAIKIIREVKEKKAVEERERLEREAVPVDRTKRTLTDGSPETPDHREIDPETGMQKGYIVLSADERAKGFVRPVRRTYTHKVCGIDTTMNWALSETYARDPKFYDGTFCAHCRTHKPLNEFVWAGTKEQVGS